MNDTVTHNTHVRLPPPAWRLELPESLLSSHSPCFGLVGEVLGKAPPQVGTPVGVWRPPYPF
ncbi:hypothetical protein B9Q03_04650 [Candidatus Marsarchaeota G2 archaeon OSP_D]|uniref:Uncharacterized protein n=1 Tax=Candidatus Marsarchaeota G2 archaeon OSP_D TaxID=1978157 RepID=A0A2R6AY74_9ARCH|nr:MAG: hypothetical protein B9Q03_04650 [Candidatus Marsarchaeota G2 archaeon OSP_D]